MTGRSPRSRPREGFSLVDLMVAFAILGLATLPLIGLFSSAGRQARQTQDHEQATALAEKVAEELRISNWEDVHLLDEIEGAQDYAPMQHVAGGISTFFGPIEDQAPPFGRIRPGEDPPIDERFGALHTQLESFQMGAKSRPSLLPETGSVLDLTLTCTWTDFRFQPQSLVSLTDLGHYGLQADPPAAVEDRQTADAMIVRALYPSSPAATLKQQADEVRGDVDLLRALGDTVLVVTGLVLAEPRLESDEAGLEADLAALPSGASSGADLAESARLHVALARACERRTAAYLQAMVYLSSTLKSLMLRLTPAAMGTPPVAPQRYMGALLQLASIPYRFGASLTRARQEYVKAYNDPIGAGLAPRVRLRAFLKVLELRKLEVLTVGPQDTRALLAMLDGLSRYEDGKNENFVHFATAELSMCKDIPTLKGTYAVPARFQAFEDFKQDVAPAVTRILSIAATQRR